MTDRLTLADTVFLRSLQGIGPQVVNHVVWVLPRPVRPEAIEALDAALAAGIVARSPVRPLVPGARHLWRQQWGSPGVRQEPPVARADLDAWIEAHAEVDLDPRTGPGWRTTWAPVAEGGCVVSVAASHLVADGGGLLRELAAALRGGEPLTTAAVPSGPRRLVADARDGVERVLPVLGWAARQVPGALRREKRASAPSAVRGASPAVGPALPDGWTPPATLVRIDRDAWDAVARGTSANTVFVAWVRALLADEGDVRVAVPMSARTDADAASNMTTITGVDVPQVDSPTDVALVRERLKAAYQRGPAPMPVPRELLQMLPPRVLRRLPQPPVARAMASSLGAGPPGLGHFDGVDADEVWTYATHRAITAQDAAQTGAGVACWHSRVGRHEAIWVVGVDPALFPDRRALESAVDGACEAVGLPQDASLRHPEPADTDHTPDDPHETERSGKPNGTRKR